ncbi:MAG: TSUP family transporter, partial [Candidatus Pelagibacter sp.]
YIFPLLALICNIIVVTGNCFNYIRAGNHNFKLLTPFLIGSVPLAFIGGTLEISKEIFEILLFLVLTIAGVLLLINNKAYQEKNFKVTKLKPFLYTLIGSILGLISGIVGIGGGIFLSPILFLLKIEKPKNIATSASLFILINSISGVLGQLTKQTVINEILIYWPLFFGVLVGGLVGNFLNIKIFRNRVLAILTSLLVIFVSVRVGIKIFF